MTFSSSQLPASQAREYENAYAELLDRVAETEREEGSEAARRVHDRGYSQLRARFGLPE